VSFRSMSLPALVAGLLVGCSGPATTSTGEELTLRQILFPDKVKVPASNEAPPAYECNIDHLGSGITQAHIDEWASSHRALATDQAAFDELCANLRAAIDTIVKLSSVAQYTPERSADYIRALLTSRAILGVIEGPAPMSGQLRSARAAGSEPSVAGEEPAQLLSIDGVTTGAIEAEFPCGEDGPHGLVLCASDNSVPSGDTFAVSMVLGGDIPLDDPALYMQLAFVFDADADTTNNYEASPQYPNDFFQDTDLWYEVLIDPLSGPTFSVKDARDSNIQVVPSDARVIIDGPLVMALIPADEMGAACPGYRSTSFVHQGDYAQQPPHFWNGDTEPTIDEPLEPVCEP
jgi:hypothetical protein